jgi:hypothetical protein
MTKRTGEKAFLERVRKTLDQGEERIDARTRSRLLQIRVDALERAGLKKRFFPKWIGIPAAGLAAAAAVVLLFSIALKEPRFPIVDQNIEDVEILSSNEGLEFFEDLDFYTWLSMQNESAG